jgi:hypothetical protein
MAPRPSPLLYRFRNIGCPPVVPGSLPSSSQIPVSAARCRSSRAVSRCPYRHAKCSGVEPKRSWPSMAAPAPRHAAATSVACPRELLIVGERARQPASQCRVSPQQANSFVAEAVGSAVMRSTAAHCTHAVSGCVVQRRCLHGPGRSSTPSIRTMNPRQATVKHWAFAHSGQIAV